MTKEKNDMANEYNFKVGDRVRLKRDNTFIGTIIDVGFNSVNIVWDCEPDEIYQQRYENIEHIDRRTAFLTRLQSLLKEHNATIQAYMSDVDTAGLCIYFADENVEEADYKQNDTICEITADNIMDFDKE